MKISDLLEKKGTGFLDEKIVHGDLIALDGKTGKILFDTTKNKREYISQFMDGKVISLWADIRLVKGIYGDLFRPIMKCYVSHDSWVRGDQAE